MHRHHLIISSAVLSALILVGSFGCEAKKQTVSQAKTKLPSVEQPEGQTSSTKPAPSNAATEQEAEMFAKQWQQALENGDVGEVERLVDWRQITERAIENFDLDEKQRSETIRQSNAMSRTVATNMKTMKEKGGSYRLVRIAKRDDYVHAVFRLLTPESSLNYHDLRVIKTADGVKADQFFVAATGEEMSDTLRGIFTPLIAKNKTILARLSGAQKQALEDVKKLQKMSQLLRLAQHQQVFDLYDQLSDEGKKQKTAMLLRIMASGQLAEDAYFKAIEEYAEAFPSDPSLAILTMDAAIMKKDLERLEQSRKQLNVWTGGDGYIDLAVGAVLADAGEVERAVELTKDIDPSEIDLVMAYDFKLSIALPAEDYDTVLKNLLVLRDKFGMQLDISSSSAFADFTASPQGKQFLSQ